MKKILFITGSRSIENAAFLAEALQLSNLSIGEISKIVHGGAKGVDRLADDLAKSHDIETKVFRPTFPANSQKWAIKKAYLDRNTEMAQICDCCIGVWDGKSTGTKDAIAKVKKLGKPFHLFAVRVGGIKLVEKAERGLFE